MTKSSAASPARTASTHRLTCPSTVSWFTQRDRALWFLRLRRLRVGGGGGALSIRDGDHPAGRRDRRTSAVLPSAHRDVGRHLGVTTATAGCTRMRGYAVETAGIEPASAVAR